ncbi:DUF2815 family protein [Bradyrhizobium liaoningense]|uniref:ssDNA-binding protein n=1 Tax=Bradyrhizobium liaoningense TaxID=43992 RepID=UPI001BAB546A|nr:ssDNA-binding protein [Bradyrhizobium liaoningense]MBR0876918.1 DUF2815 family protein [Bradyrhizobium liaoningense]
MADETKPKRFFTPVFRLSFPNLYVARKNEDDPNSKAKFGLSAVWTPAKFTPKDKELWLAIMKELNAVSVRDFKAPWKELPDNIKRGVRDGRAKSGMEGYGEGTRFANLTTHSRPGVIDSPANGKADIGPEHGNADLIYPGCFCRASVNVYSYGLKPGSKGKGVALGLFNVQKIKDGPRLDNRVAAADDFDDEIDSAWLDQEDSDFDNSDEDDFE